jgi:hypothetical protein
VKRWILAIFLVVILLTGCSQTTEDGGPLTEDGQPSTAYSPSPTPSSVEGSTVESSTPTLAPSATSTPVPCDPLTADYCISAGHFLLQRPISPADNDRADASYRYGYTQGGAREPHHGVEFPNAEGTPVLAAAAGTVVFAGDDAATLVGPLTGFYGKVVVIEHHLPGIPETVYTLYGHLSRIDVSPGQMVAAGETIGAVGLTGIAVGSHLHFEVRLGTNDYRSTRNPELWLAPRSTADGPLGVLALRIIDAYGDLLSVFPVVQYYPDPTGSPAWEMQIEPYAHETLNSDDALGENFVMGDLPAGWYRITFVQMGGLYERWIEIQPGKLTLAVFQAP